ncbi:hypothetical protein [Microcoleus sp. B7-D4]|uniref:hypothetical protein n=1 Tax=Microcoleus sp. B7-D4 TaxID=2818696 RepID=UPI002FD4E91A
MERWFDRIRTGSVYCADSVGGGCGRSIGYNSPAVASAIERELSDAIDAGQLTAADVLAVVGKTEFTRFKQIAE